MCGIAGWFALEDAPGKDAVTILEKMCAGMKDRGPDDNGIHLFDEGRGGFGHTRLKVIDLSENGAQPMTSIDGRMVLTYNGEIYNHRAIRKRLEKEGHVRHWRGTSDTETLLEAIRAYGVAQALVYCKGMFALAVYDMEKGELSLARDRIGEKPLYFGFVDDAFVFASDIKAIAGVPEFHKTIDETVLSAYFTCGCIPAPYSIYKGIRKLMPGTVLTLKKPFAVCDPVNDGAFPLFAQKRGAVKEGKNYRVTHYYSAAQAALEGQAHPFAGSYEEACAQLETLLIRSVRAQAVADVPVGAFLSGGIDSATVVSLLQAGATRTGNTRTFTIGFEDPAYDEADAAFEIASHLHTSHTTLRVTEKEAKDVIPLLSGIYGEPFADSSQIPTYLISKLTRAHVTVALTGDGGDELFAGYNSYYSVDRIWGKMKRIPYGLRRAAGVFALPVAGRMFPEDSMARIKGKLLLAKGPMGVQRIQQSGLDAAVMRLLSFYPENAKTMADVLPERTLSDPIRQMMLLDLYTYHPDDILTKVDRASMAVSLETRIPFLSPEVIKFAWSLPTDFLTKDGKGKRILRDVLRRHVPDALFEGKPKKGFSVPLKRWLKEDSLKEWAKEMLSPSRIRNEGLLDADAVREIWEDYAERGQWRPQVWYALMFEQWMQDR